MESPGTAATYHVLLVGIDDYKEQPLEGCVNDIDAVQRLLLGPRLGLPVERIRRLASPRADRLDRLRSTIAEQPATLANVRAALTALGSEEVSPGDRVLIYYSGHGVRVRVRSTHGGTFFREALVPVDFGHGGLNLLYDYEINELLRAIVARTRSVTLVLDCCHAASVPRGSSTQPPLVRTISKDVLDALIHGHALDDPGDSDGAMTGQRRLASGVDDCHVVAACLGNQKAYEDDRPGELRHGLLTSALLAALRATDLDLSTVTWGRIWQTVRAEIARGKQSQDPVMFGSPGRAVLGGPPVDGDVGFTVTSPGSRHRIEAGTLAGVTEGAVLAVYGERPARFPPLDAPDDHRARVGMLRVASATASTALADPLEPFALPPGARARLVQAGKEARLRCAWLPAHPELSAAIAGSPLLEEVDPETADVRLVWAPSIPGAPLPSRPALASGRWLLTDRRHRVDPGAPALFALRPLELHRARALLEHYHAYARPLRIVTHASDLPGALELSVLRWSGLALRAEEAQTVPLPDAPARDANVYSLQDGEAVCFQVHNGSPCALRVTLINAAASGRVQPLGEEVIEPGSSHRFWAHSALGEPFHMQLPRGTQRGLDRLVAIGTTAMERDLGYLQVDGTFAEAVAVTKSHGKDLAVRVARERVERVERWTATEVILETSAS